MPDLYADFTGVQERPSYNYTPGDHTFRVSAITVRQGNAGPYMDMDLIFTDGPHIGQPMNEMVSLAPNALWRAKSFLKAVGYEVPEGPFRFRTEDIINLTFRAHIETEEGNARFGPRSRISKFYGKHEQPDAAPPAPSSAPLASPSTPQAATPTPAPVSPQPPAPAPAPAPVNPPQPAPPATAPQPAPVPPVPSSPRISV